MEDISLSICVPAFNEEKNLRAAAEELLLTLSALVQKLEVVIVDDGSTDSTSQLADQIGKEYPQIKIIHHQMNLGIGTCYRDALAIAAGDYYTWFPADRENSAEEFVQCLAYLKEDTIVLCHHQGQDPRSALRRGVSRSYTWILNKSFHLNLTYYNGLAVFPVSILRSFPLVSSGFFFTAEGLIKAIKRGCRVVELSIPLRKRAFGKSKILNIPSISRMLGDLIRFKR